MAKTIGSLNVSMSLGITDFITNLEKVKDDMAGLEAITSEASKHFDNDVAGIMGDALHKFSKSSKLSGEDAVKFAASLKGMGLDADAITGTLDRFAKNIGRFGKNAGEAAKAFSGVLSTIGKSDKALLGDIQMLESMGVKAFDMMAKELTKVEGKAVSTAEVMKRIASGAVSGKDALKLLTQGGQVPAGGGDAAKESQAKSKLTSFLNYVEGKITGAASSIYSKVMNLIMNPVTAIGGVLASYGVYKIYDRAVMAFANTEEILTRIKGLAGEASASRIGGVMNEIANKGRIAQDVVGKLATGFLGLGASGADTARMIESFGRTSLIAGSGATDVFNKLGEVAQNMMKTGVASKEDFAALASMGLPVYDALAQRLSAVQGRAISAQEAMQMLVLGAVGTQDAINALAGLQTNADVIKQSEAMAGTLKGIYARLAGEIEGFFTEFGGAIVEALDLKGFSNGLVAFVQNFRNNFESLVPAIKNVGMILAVVRDVLFAAFQGLVNFFTTLGGADATVGNIDNIRSVVIQFAQGVIAALQSVMIATVDILNNIIKAVGGLEKFGNILKLTAVGTIGGTLMGGPVGTGVGFGVGLIGGLVQAAFGEDKAGINPQAIKDKMNDAFKSIADAVGATGTDQAQSIVQQFIGSFNTAINDAAAGTINQNNMIMKINTAFDKMIDGLDIGITNGTMGHTAFLNQLSGGTATAIAMFKRQLDLGSITTDEFAKTMDRIRTTAFAALDAQLSAGTITNEEYGNSIMAIQNQFDALNPPDLAGLNAFMGGDNVPQWIKDLSKVETPLEIYRRKMEELQMALADRPDLFAAGAAQLADELEKSVGAVEALKNPGALLAGSAAAFSQVLKIQNAGNGENAADRLARIQQQALQQDRARNELLQQIGAAAANQNNLVIANF